MTQTLSEVEILEGVRRAVSESLLLPEERVTPGARLISDLGASSLDLLDILFGLQARFGIEVHEDDFNLLTRLNLPPEEIERDGRLTEAAVRRLRDLVPGMDQIGDGISVSALPRLITVETICLLVRSKMA